MFLRSALLSLFALAAAKEMPKDEIKAAELYDSGIRHANNVALKKVAIPQILHCQYPATSEKARVVARKHSEAIQDHRLQRDALCGSPSNLCAFPLVARTRQYNKSRLTLS
jgi:hypothetical protein